ncbi:hypothetical protein DRP05_03355 [Archaeoglobales archaeon]|nr:MAG: hypothetical protein DRP05_03355 [Archaeoglobales archaeon]
MKVRIGLVLLLMLVMVVGSIIDIVMANINSKPEGVIRIGKPDKKTKELINNALKDGKLTLKELENLIENDVKVLATDAPEDVLEKKLSKIKYDYDISILRCCS